MTHNLSFRYNADMITKGYSQGQSQGQGQSWSWGQGQGQCQSWGQSQGPLKQKYSDNSIANITSCNKIKSLYRLREKNVIAIKHCTKGDSCNLLKGNNFNKSVYKRIILESNRKRTKFRKTYIKQTLMSMWKAYRLKLLSNKRRRPVEL